MTLEAAPPSTPMLSPAQVSTRGLQGVLASRQSRLYVSSSNLPLQWIVGAAHKSTPTHTAGPSSNSSSVGTS
eukprot:SAG31_NODE_3206_length_4554_cov_4.595960_5_plen_72_part_00